MNYLKARFGDKHLHLVHQAQQKRPCQRSKEILEKLKTSLARHLAYNWAFSNFATQLAVLILIDRIRYADKHHISKGYAKEKRCQIELNREIGRCRLLYRSAGAKFIDDIILKWDFICTKEVLLAAEDHHQNDLKNLTISNSITPKRYAY